jgi:prevent-host-death family protein
VSTISLSDLGKKPEEFFKSVGNEDVVITSNGCPVAVLMGIGAGSVESTETLIRSVRALQAQTALQKSAQENGSSNLSEADIDAEIAEVREARSKK